MLSLKKKKKSVCPDMENQKKKKLLNEGMPIQKSVLPECYLKGKDLDKMAGRERDKDTFHCVVSALLESSMSLLLKYNISKDFLRVKLLFLPPTFLC